MFRLLLAAISAPLLVLAAPAPLAKRTPGRATYYAVGLGACGQYNVASDFIVALNQAQFDTGGYPSSQCFRGITINYNGKSAHATVMDECPDYGCNYGDLDMSEGLFTFFEPESTGVFYMNWSFDGEDGGGGSPPPAQTTTQPAWTPDPTTPAWTPPATTSTTSVYVPPPTTSTTQPAVTEQSTPDDNNAGTNDTPTNNNSGFSGSVFDAVNKAVVNLANIAYAAHAA